MVKNLSFLFLLLSLRYFFHHTATASPTGRPSYMRFTQDATQFPAESEYDYIIVGGGTAGCSLAATLSGGGRSVFLLERGGVPDEFPSLATSSGFLSTLSTTNQDSPAQPFVSEEGVPNTRARVLGGGSAINAGFYSRAHPEFFTDVLLNWDLQQVNKSYEWIERALVHRPEVRGWQAALRDGLIEAGVGPYNGFTVNHITGTKIGGSIFDAAGMRHSAADLLSFARPDRIRVATRATVDRIFLNQVQPDSGSGTVVAEAVGVVFLDRLGRRRHAMTRPGGEVILCAGALGSPQLLLLSGIGPPSYLATWGIPVVVPNPDVGQYLFDNPRNGISILPPSSIDHSLIQVVGIPEEGDSFLEAASYVVPFVSRVDSILHRSSTPLYISVATIMEKVAGPASFGSLRLASLDPRDSPLVRFNYFTDPANLDLERCVSGLRRVGDVLQSQSMDGFRPTIGTWVSPRRESRARRGEFRYVGPSLPENRSDDEAMRGFCRRNVATLWHYHGGCLAGRVVDRDFRVIGTRGLRVVDGSTLAVSPGTNPQATIMMMGRYMGQRMLASRRYRRNRRRLVPPPPPPAPPDL